MALTACEITVASAAPRIPIPNIKINSGSSMIFSTAPIATDIIAVFAFPCAVINVLSPTEICTNNVPHR